MPFLKNNKHELFAYPGYKCTRWRRRHGKPGRLGVERSFWSGRCAVRVDDKFSANFAAKMDEGELNTIASELKLLGLVIETATATSVSASAPLEGMSTVRRPLLLEACSLFQANAMGEMLPAAGPVRVRDDRPQKPKSADMMGHNDGPALDGTNPFSTPPAPQGPAQATPAIPPPGVGAPGGSPPRPRCRRDAASATADCRACPVDRRACRLWLYARCWAGYRPCRQRPSFRKSKRATRSRIVLEKDTNHYLIFWRMLTISAAAAMIISVRVEECRTLGHRWSTPGRRVRHNLKLGARRGPASLPSTQISGDAPPLFINRCGGLKIGVIALRSTSSRYGAAAQAFHWLTVMLVPAAYVVSKGDPDSLYSAGADGLRRIHETLGVLVFIVVVLRLLWRLIESTPTKQPMPRWMAAAAKLVHFALYALLTAIPVTAVLGTWLLGIPVTLPGFDIAPQIAKGHELGQLIMELHTALGNAILWVAGVHAAAALFHHFYLRDEVFQSMAPGRMND